MCRARFGILNDLHNDLISEGVTDFIEVGPGIILQGLGRKISSDVAVFGAEI